MTKLYGVGVGPGDPELMTLKAVRAIRECDVIAIPGSGQKVNAAYTIVKGAVPEVEEKELAEIPMPMTRDSRLLEESHREGTDRITAYLDEGKSVAFLTLGDPSIYSTYMYIHYRAVSRGYEAEMIPGIPSFCAAAARLGESLTDAAGTLHIIPASYEGTEEYMEMKGTKVLMKSGKSLGKIKQLLQKHPEKWTAKMVERCGMEGERVFSCAEEIDPDAGYFSIVVVKDK